MYFYRFRMRSSRASNRNRTCTRTTSRSSTRCLWCYLWKCWPASFSSSIRASWCRTVPKQTEPSPLECPIKPSSVSFFPPATFCLSLACPSIYLTHSQRLNVPTVSHADDKGKSAQIQVTFVPPGANNDPSSSGPMVVVKRSSTVSLPLDDDVTAAS